MENFILDSRDWRSHLEQMKQLKANISTGLNGTKNQLDKLHTDIGNTLDKIKMREMYLNKQLEPTLNEFRILQVIFINLLCRKLKNSLSLTKKFFRTSY